MKYNLYAIRDDKVGFMVPTSDPNDAVAVRGFSSAVKRAERDMDERVFDMELYRVGEFDIDSGKIKPCNPPAFIVSAVSILNGGNDNE